MEIVSLAILLGLVLYLGILEQIARKYKTTISVFILLFTAIGGLAVGSVVTYLFYLQAVKKAAPIAIQFSDSFALPGGIVLGIGLVGLTIWRCILGTTLDYFGEMHHRFDKPGAFWFYIFAFGSTGVGAAVSTSVYCKVL